MWSNSLRLANCRVLGGTIGSLHLGIDSTSGLNPVATAGEECYGVVSAGQTVSSNGWRDYQQIVKRMVGSRDSMASEGNKYIPVLVWRINTVDKMAWLICNGVDGEEGEELDPQ